MIYTGRCYNTISQDSFKKIFPEEYYNKFAKHLKILEFQKNILNSKPPTYKLKFVKPQIKKTAKSYVGEITQRKKISRFAPIEDIVQKDRQQIERMKKVARSVNSKLQFVPKQNKKQIKSFLNEVEIDPVVIQRMRFLSKGEQQKNQDKVLEQRQKNRISKKFKKPQFYQSSEIIRYYSQRSIKNREIIKLFQSKINPQNIAAQTKLRKQKQEAQIKKDRFNKNFVQQTNKIRKFGSSIQVISQFDGHSKYRNSMKFIQNIFNQKNKHQEEGEQIITYSIIKRQKIIK